MKKLNIILVALVLLLLFILFCLYKANKNKDFNLGPYIVSIPKNEFVLETDNNNENIVPDNWLGQWHVMFNFKSKTKKDISSSLSIYSWYIPDLIFLDKNNEKGTINRLDTFKSKVEEFTDIDKLKKYVFNQDYNYQPYSVDNVFTLNYFGGPYFSFPIYIKEVKNTTFEKVFYIEAIEGNGWPGFPEKILTIIDKSSWLVIKDDSNNIDWSNYPLIDFDKCRVQEPLYKEVECIVGQWSANYRDEKKNEIWINKWLKRIEKRLDYNYEIQDGPMKIIITTPSPSL